MTGISKNFYTPIPDKVIYAALQAQVIARREQKQTLREIGRELKIHPVTLRKMLGMEVCAQGRPFESGPQPFNYRKFEAAWQEMVKLARLPKFNAAGLYRPVRKAA